MKNCPVVRPLVALLLVAIAACATTRVTTDRDPNANFAQYKSFGVKSGKVVQNGVVDPSDTLVMDRIENALTAGFQHKGLQTSPDKPDLIVTYTAGAKEKTELVNDGGGWYDYGYDDLDWTEQYRQGTLVIDVVDSGTKKLVWRAVAVADDENFRSDKVLKKAVDSALAKYPTTNSAAKH
jgi:hypothetical protein